MNNRVTQTIDGAFRIAPARGSTRIGRLARAAGELAGFTAAAFLGTLAASPAAAFGDFAFAVAFLVVMLALRFAVVGRVPPAA